MKRKYEQAVAAAITAEIKLTEVDPDVFTDGAETMILLDNPAELAYVSAMFLVSGIDHGIAAEHPVRLALVDDDLIFSDRKRVLLSDTVLKRGCQGCNVKAWEMLSKRNEIIKLHVADRDYYKFSYGDRKERWTCRNMYGVTHVCVEQADICRINKISDGLYPVYLEDVGKTYKILRKDNGGLIGYLGKRFVDMLDALKRAGEISSSPVEINGISLRVNGNEAEFLGMGHLKFMEY